MLSGALLFRWDLRLLYLGPPQLIFELFHPLFHVGLVLFDLLGQLFDVFLGKGLVQIHLVYGVAQEELGGVHHCFEAEVSADFFPISSGRACLLEHVLEADNVLEVVHEPGVVLVL